MPRIDPNSNVGQEAKHEVNHATAKRVRKARKALTPKPYVPSKRQPVAPHGIEATDAPKPYVPSKRPVKAPHGVEASDAPVVIRQHYATALANKLKTKGGSLKSQRETVHELARLGVLPSSYAPGEPSAPTHVAAPRTLTRAQQAAVDEATFRRTGRLPAAFYVKHAHDPGIINFPGAVAKVAAELGVSAYHSGPVETAQRVLHVVDALKENASHAQRATPPTATEQAKAEATFRKTGQLPRALKTTKSNNFPAIVKVGNNVPGLLAKDAAALAIGTYHDPIGVPTKTAKQAALATAASIPAVASAVIHPGDTGKALIADYAKRGEESLKAKVERVRKEGGLPEVADLGTAFSLGGAAAGKTALVAKAPERAAKLLSGGATKVPKKGGPVRYYVGRSVDARKAAKYEAKAAKGTPLTALEHEALQANRAAGHVVAVVPRRSARKIAGVVANARGKAVAGLKYDSARGPFMKLAQERFNLNKDESKALWLGTEVGIRDARTAATVGKKLRDKIAASRTADPVGHERNLDVLAQIDEVLKDPEKHFTPNFAAVMDRIHQHAQEISQHEPQFTTATKEARRRAVQKYVLDLEQGVGGEVPAVAPIIPHGPLAPPFARTKTGEAKYQFEDLPPHVHDYQPSAEGISGKTWYHGTNTPNLKAQDLDGTQTQIDSLFGQGVYLTDDRSVARSYANNRAGVSSNGGAPRVRRGEPVVYEAKIHVKNPLDMDAPANAAFHSALNKSATSIGHLGGNLHDPDPFIIDEMAKMLEEKGGKHTNADLYSTFRNAAIEYAHDYGLSRGDLTEYFQDLASDLRKAGFDSLTHVGGLRAGHGEKLHQVTILLDPANTGSLRGLEPQAKHFDVAPAAPTGEIAVGKYANVPRTNREPTGERIPGVPPLKYDQETDAAFNARIDAEAAKAGLAQPTYFRSEKQRAGSPDYGARVVGGTAKSTGKQYLGKNLEQGIFDTSYNALVNGYAHNVKAAHNYPLVAKLDEQNRLRSFSPDSEPQGTDLGTLLNRINRAEPLVNKSDIVLVNKGIFEHGVDPENRARSVFAAGSTPDSELAKTPGWVAWPAHAERELQAELHAGTLGGRSLDVAKGAASKAILLTANAPWLAFQMASEFGVTGIASKGRALTPRNILGTKRWWDAMNHRQRTHVSTELGLGATGSDTASIRLGATTNARLANVYRDLKSADFWHQPRVAGQPLAHIINPVHWLRAADQGKTNVTRLLLAHSELTKRISPAGMNSLTGALHNMGHFMDDAGRLLPTFEKPTAAQLQHLVDNPEILQKLGETVSTALGDWTTMTAKERTWANRFVMFYPFVRYSVRLLTHTLPVDHPAVTSVLAELGQLKAEEYRAIFGNDDLPWNIGKVYFGKTGESNYIDLNRANPALNSIVTGLAHVGTHSSNVSGDVVGALPPYGQWLFDHLSGINSFKARPLRFNGNTDPFWNKPWEIKPADHGKLLLAEVQSLFYPAREAMGRLHPESQSDESSLLFPTPMKYKAPSAITGGGEGARIQRLVAQNAVDNQNFTAKHNGGIADLLLGPLAPHPSRDAKSAAERQQIADLKDKQTKGAAARKHYRITHGGKNPAKPHAFGGAGGGGKVYRVR